MKQVLRTANRSLAESLRISLVAEGIEAIITADSAISLPTGPITVAVVHDADYSRALDILKGLQVTPTAPVSPAFLSRRVFPLLVLVVLVLAALLWLNRLLF